jgi:hypothetical protein
MNDSTIFAGSPVSPNVTQSINESPDTRSGKLDNLADVIDFCKSHDFPADIVGQWVWIRFPEKPSKESRDALKSAGFKWIKVRGQWAHDCGHPSRRGKGCPRAKYPYRQSRATTSDNSGVSPDDFTRHTKHS